MKISRLLAHSIAAVLLAPTLSAITDTWDGGGADDNIGTDLNWVDNTAPASDLLNTDIVFAGLAGLTPFFLSPFSTDSITFSNTAGAFVLDGATVFVGLTGIVNNDAQTMTFENFVDFSNVPTSTINAASGGLSFEGFVELPTDTLTVTGGDPTNFHYLIGPGAVVKQGAGTMTLGAIFQVLFDCDIVVEAGTLAMLSQKTFQSTASIAVNGTSTFNVNGVLLLSGAQLTREAGASISIPAGRNLYVFDGADVIITGDFQDSTQGHIEVNGAGSTFTTTSTLELAGNSTTEIIAGGSMSSGAGPLRVGTSGGGGTVTVDGAGSSLSGGQLIVALSGQTGLLTFSNGSTGTFGAMQVDVSGAAGTLGILSVQSGSTVTGNSLGIATNAIANSGTVTVTGAGSMLTLSGLGPMVIGAANLSSGTLNVNSGAVFHSGTGQTTVHATGEIVINGGTYDSRGNLTLNFGQLTRNATGVLTLAPGTTLTAQANGDVTITGSFENASASTIVVTGPGSTFTTTADLLINGGSALNVASGGDVSSGAGMLRAGTSRDGTVTIDGGGSTLTSSGAVLGDAGHAGSLTFSNSSLGVLGAIAVANSLVRGTSGLLEIQSGADVAATGLSVATTIQQNTGIVTLTGVGSTLTLSGAASATIGAASASTATLNVQSGAILEGGTGLTTVNRTGTIAIAGGTFNAHGNVTISGGQLTRDAAGTFALDAGRILTVQADGDAIFTGSYIAPAATFTITGNGSTLSTTGSLLLGSGSSTTASAGGSIHTGSGFAEIGTSGGNGTVVVDGPGSSLTTGGTRIGENSFTGSLTFSNGSTGSLGPIFVDSSSAVAGTTGILRIQSGADVTATGMLVATDAAATTGTVEIDGAGSSLTITGLITTIGASGASTATFNVQNGGTFTTGIGLTTVNATGDLNINAGGTMIVRGDMIVHSSLDIADGGTVVLDATAPFAAAPTCLAAAHGFAAQSGDLDGDATALQTAGQDPVVPEPGIGALLATALALLGLRQRLAIAFPQYSILKS